MKHSSIFLYLLFSILSVSAKTDDTFFCSNKTHNKTLVVKKYPNPVLKLFKKKHASNRRATAAILAFPFPFGIVGLHRIYLGTKPHVPVVYISTLGGVFGVLPLIDFITIVSHKELKVYENNGGVFMWLDTPKKTTR